MMVLQASENATIETIGVCKQKQQTDTSQKLIHRHNRLQPQWGQYHVCHHSTQIK